MNETISFLSQHGALVLAAAVFAEQIGLPLPALPFLIAAGALVWHGGDGAGHGRCLSHSRRNGG